ncbi:MAG: hypothetical protein HY898_31640 [Deltaproteobacteria bacterium]|nr:hypothetical protein [Deltaproteobacteria bacterium]
MPRMLQLVISVISCALVLTTSATSQADLAPSPGLRAVTYKLSLENQSAFPDCLIVVPSCYPVRPDADSVAPVLEGELGCTPWGRIFGMKKADYDAARPSWQTRMDPLAKFEQAPGVMKATAMILAQRVVPEDLDVVAIRDVLRIDQCGEGKLSVTYVKAIYTRKDGTQIEQAWTTNDRRPDPSLVVPRLTGRGCGGCASVGEPTGRLWGPAAGGIALTIALRRRRRPS